MSTMEWEKLFTKNDCAFKYSCLTTADKPTRVSQGSLATTTDQLLYKENFWIVGSEDAWGQNNDMTKRTTSSVQWYVVYFAMTTVVYSFNHACTTKHTTQ